jgi:membrane-bound lytic murein transglycosylase D
MTRTRQRPYVAIALLPLAAAFGPSLRAQGLGVTAGASQGRPAPAIQAAVAVSAVEQAAAPSDDPVIVLIAESQLRFVAGQRELGLGHVEAAKQEFNRAVGLLLESSYGARTEPRIREHFDRLVDRISTYELKALAQGDGFTETKYEPASIDDLLALSTTVEPSAAPAPTDSVETDLQTGGHDIPIPLNQRVLAYIDLFQGRLHDFIEEGMKRGSKYLPMIQGVFRAEGLPLDLAYVPLVESAFKPNALSKASAKGVWQFMKGTALENGLRHDWYIDERSDPQKATVAAANYLKTLANLFGGDWHLALASYNGGPGRLQKAIKRVGVNDFWTLSAKRKLLPRETREYVPMILAAIVIARNPAQYGFSFESEEQPAFETVTLPRPVDLRRVAEWAGTTIDTIQALNPELRRWTTPVKDSQYTLKVPMGTSDDVNRRLGELGDIELVSLKWHTVKRGETLPGIARTLRVSRADLAEANDLRVTARVAAGQKLLVPQGTGVLIAARTERRVPAAEAPGTVAHDGELARVTSSTALTSLSRRVKSTYEVRKGDTLTSIARLYKTTVASVKTWNPRVSQKRLTAGQRLTVYQTVTR